MKPPLAQDFVTLNGLNKIILPALRSSEEDLIAKGAIVLGSASQSNTKVQVCEFLGQQTLLTIELWQCPIKGVRPFIFVFQYVVMT